VPTAAQTGGPALRLAGLRPLARSTCHAAPQHREPPGCATDNGLTPSLRPYELLGLYEALREKKAG
jgi:hypothetical protein